MSSIVAPGGILYPAAGGGGAGLGGEGTLRGGGWYSSSSSSYSSSSISSSTTSSSSSVSLSLIPRFIFFSISMSRLSISLIMSRVPLSGFVFLGFIRRSRPMSDVVLPFSDIAYILEGPPTEKKLVDLRSLRETKEFFGCAYNQKNSKRDRNQIYQTCEDESIVDLYFSEEESCFG